METTGRNSDQHVARNDLLRIQDLAFVHHPDGESREVVLAVGKISGVFRSLAADQGTACPAATLRNPTDHRCRHLDV